MICTGINKSILNNNSETNFSMAQTKKGNDMDLTWSTNIVSAHGRKFFVKTNRENHHHYVETVMLGSADECKDFLASVTLLDKDLKIFTKNTSRPRHISLEKWGKMGLVISEDTLSSIWTPDLSDPETAKFRYTFAYSVEKV